MDKTGVNDVAVVSKLVETVREQQDTISMMQVQLDLQNEKLEKLQSEVDILKQKLEPNSVGIKDSDDKKSIAEIAKETAEAVLKAQTDYTFDEASGLYYDRNSGYYYDPNRQLFYNGHTRTYYTWDQSSNSYEFHSQLPESGGDKVSTKTKKRKRTKRSSESSCSSSGENKKGAKEKIKTVVKIEEDVEEGELSESNESSGEDSDGSDTATSDHSVSTTDSRTREEMLPCLRAVVVESTVPSMTKGFLFIVPCTGGSVGREGSNHLILLPDSNVSKNHANITFEHEEGKYYITDIGSQNGTVLNGERISNSKEQSSPSEILHGSLLKIGDTTLLVHIHPGSFTCGLCEPGLVSEEKKPIYDTSLTKAEIERLRKKKLKELRSKYGIERASGPGAVAQYPENYKDRAQERRKVKGSDNPYEKTEVASVDESIRPDNKGFKMLSKMGWNTGTALGKPVEALEEGDTPSRLVEPIKVDQRAGRAGLGFESGWPPGFVPQPQAADSTRLLDDGEEPSKNKSRKGKASKSAIAKKTLERFNRIPKSNSSPQNPP